MSAQMSWLNTTLIGGFTTGCGGSGCTYTVVASHYPLYGANGQFGSQVKSDANYQGGPPGYSGSWPSNTIGRFNCWATINQIFNQQNYKYAPHAWLNGHDHANAMARARRWLGPPPRRRRSALRPPLG
jgi:hypothetical protein